MCQVYSLFTNKTSNVIVESGYTKFVLYTHQANQVLAKELSDKQMMV